MKEWNDAEDLKEPAEERKVKMERENIHRKEIYCKEYYSCTS